MRGGGRGPRAGAAGAGRGGGSEQGGAGGGRPWGEGVGAARAACSLQRAPGPTALVSRLRLDVSGGFERAGRQQLLRWKSSGGEGVGLKR